MKTKTIVSMHVTVEDLSAVERVLDGVVNISRHAVLLAAMRVGLAQFVTDPGLVLPHVSTQRACKRARLRAV